MVLKIEQVRKHIQKTQELLKNGISHKEIEDTMSEFKKDYPYLMKMILENGNNDQYLEGLERMLNAAQMVENKETSLEEMDKKVGFELAKEYIYPIIDMEKEVDSFNPDT